MVNINTKGISVEQADKIARKKGLISTKLKQIRVTRNISQNELAKRSGISIRVIQDYEQHIDSISNAKLETLLDLCLALNCHIEDILEDEETIRKLYLLSEIVTDFENNNFSLTNEYEKEKYLFDFFFNNDSMLELTEDQRNGIKFILLDFPKRWQEILELRYKKELALSQIGKQYEITTERVRQILSKALKKLEQLKTSEYVIYGFQTWHQKSIKAEVERDVFEIPIAEMHLSGRAYNCLMRAGFTTVGKVKTLSKNDLLAMKNLGETAVNEILTKLNQYD